jgi:hypothetical protein
MSFPQQREGKLINNNHGKGLKSLRVTSTAKIEKAYQPKSSLSWAKKKREGKFIDHYHGKGLKSLRVTSAAKRRKAYQPLSWKRSEKLTSHFRTKENESLWIMDYLEIFWKSGGCLRKNTIAGGRTG